MLSSDGWHLLFTCHIHLTSTSPHHIAHATCNIHLPRAPRRHPPLPSTHTHTHSSPLLFPIDHTDCIQVSETTYELLQSHTFKPTGGVEVKGKGLMNTYLWIPSEHPDEQYQSIKEEAQVG
jgi:hypothetical protein